MALNYPSGISFGKSLDRIYDDFLETILLLKMINEILPYSINRFEKYYGKAVVKEGEKLDTIGKKELDSYLKKPSLRMEGLSHKEAIKIACNLMKVFADSDAMTRFIREMSLIFLVSKFESTLERILSAIYFSRSEILKSSKSLTFEEILNCKEFPDIYHAMVEKAVKAFIANGIDKTLKDLNEIFGLDLKESKNKAKWEALKECFYRRDVIIHNDSIPDIKYKAKSKNQNISNLTVSKDYLEKSLTVFKSCCRIIKNSTNAKFHKKNIRSN